MRMLLEESLAKRARLRPLLRMFPGREGFDIKRDALLPIVNLARWAALMVGSAALPTTERLRAASGSSITGVGTLNLGATTTVTVAGMSRTGRPRRVRKTERARGMGPPMSSISQ